MTRAEGWYLPKLTEWRRYRILTPSELANKTGIPRSALSRLENVKGRAGAKTIDRLTEALNITREQLLYEDPPTKKSEPTAA